MLNAVHYETYYVQQLVEEVLVRGDGNKVAQGQFRFWEGAFRTDLRQRLPISLMGPTFAALA